MRIFGLDAGKRAAGRPRYVGSAVALILILFAASPASMHSAGAQQESDSTNAIGRPIQRIPVPFNRPDERPEGDWVPVRSSDLAELLQQSKPPQMPRRAWIEQATYSATFDGSDLRGGVLTAEVRHESDGADLLDLEPLGLAISELAWAERPAVWGTNEGGRTTLLVDGEQKTLYGRWNLTGRKLPRSVEFDIRLPAAVVSRLWLRLPSEFLLSTSAGEVATTAAAERRDPEGPEGQETAIGPVADGSAPIAWRDWRVELGSQTRCRVVIRRRQDPSPAEPLVLTESNLSYVVRQEGMQLQAQFQVEAIGVPVNLLVFTLSAEVDVHSVTYGGVHSLSWRSVPDGADQQLAVQIPDFLLGRSRPIRIAGFARSALGENRLLPQPKLIAALSRSSALSELNDELFTGRVVKNLQNAAFLSGQVHLKVEAPVKLQTVEAEGFRQTAAVSTADAADAFSFRQYLSDAGMRINVDFPELQRAASVLAHVDTSGENWSMTAHVDWSARSGETFEAVARLAPGWEVIEVRPRSESSVLTNWDVRREGGGRRLLRIEFREAISPNRPKSVEIVARRLPLRRRRPMSLPPLRPLDQAAVSQLIAVTRPASTIPLVNAEAAFSAIEVEALPEFAARSELLETVASRGGGKPLYLLSTDPEASGSLQLEERGPAVDARAWNVLTLEASGITETFQFQVTATKTAVERLYVYLTVAGEDIEWTFPDAPAAPGELTSVRIPPDRHADWDLPAEGELWEIQLPQPQQGEFRVRGSRSRAIQPAVGTSAAIMPALAFIPGSNSFRAAVELRGDEGHGIDVDVDGLIPTDPDALIERELLEPGEPRPSGRLWQYDSAPRISHSLRIRAQAAHSRDHRLATLLLQSVISNEHSGFDRHRATFRLTGGNAAEDFRFELPQPAVLLATSVNGHFVKPQPGEDGWVVPLVSEVGANEVEIEYRFPSAGGGDAHWKFVRETHSIVVPKCDYSVLEFDWRFAIPPDARLAAEPESFLLHDRLPRLSWSERFFSPLGRPAEHSPFNPFRADSWRALWQSRDDSDGQLSNQSAGVSDRRFAPVGWPVYRASAPRFRQTPAISTWRHSRARLLAWLGFLACLLAGLLLRVREAALRSRVFGYWLSICLFAAWLSPSYYAIIAGGCLLGTVVALLFPRRLLERLRFHRHVGDREDDGMPLGSTESFPRSPATAMLIFALLTVAHSSAQEIPSDHPSESESPSQIAPNGPTSLSRPDADPIRILVPDDQTAAAHRTVPDADDDRSVVYVERRDLAFLRGLSPKDSEKTKYVVSAADYASRVDKQGAVTVAARYRVHLLPGTRSARVAFPDARSNPGRCVVNGRPHPVVLAEDGKRFYVELNRHDPPAERDGTSSSESVESFEVALTFRPATMSVSGGSGFRLNVLPMASAHLRQDFEEQPSTVELLGARGERKFPNGGRTMTALLGDVDAFQVLWSKNAEPVGGPADLEAQLAVYVQARPTWLEFTYDVDYQLVSGRVDYLLWQLPHRAERTIVRSASVNGEPVAFSTSSTEDGRSKLLLEFDTALDEDFSARVLVVVPVSPDASGRIRIPATPVVDEPLVDDDAPPYSVAVTESLLGVAAPLEFELSPAAEEGQQRSAVSEGSSVGSGAERGVRSISVESFLDGLGDEALGRQTQFAYRVNEPQELAFALAAAAPRREVRMIQTGTVRADTLDWTVSAVLETSRAPAFRHRLRIDPQLTITNISIREDDAERLAGWSRRGDTLELFLSDKTTGTQSLSLSGSRRLRASTPARLPLIAVDDAEITDSRLRLYCEPRLTARLIDAEALTEIEPPPPPAGETLEPLGEFRVPLEPDSQSPARSQPRIQVFAHGDHLRSETVTRLQRREDGDWQMTFAHRLATSEPTIRRVRLQASAEIVAKLQIDPEVLPIQEENIGPDGAVMLTLRPSGGRATSLELRFTTTLPQEPSGREWGLPAVIAPDVTDGRHYLIVVDAPGIGGPEADQQTTVRAVPDGAPRPVDVRPAGTDAVELPDGGIPAWAQEIVETDGNSSRERLYISDSLPWALVVGEISDEAASARIPLVQTRVWNDGGGMRFGRTSLLISSAAQQELVLFWPQGMRIRALFVDGRAVDPQQVEPTSQTLRIPALAGSGAHVVVLHWSQESSVDWFAEVIGPRSQPLPQPRHAAARRSFIAFVPRTGAYVTAADGLTETEPLDCRLEILEALIELGRSQLRANRSDRPNSVNSAPLSSKHAQPLFWQPLLSLHRRVELELEAAVSKANADDRHTDRQRRLDRITEGIAELRQVMEAESVDAGADATQVPLGDEETPAASRGDDWSVVAPNRDILAGRLASGDSQAISAPVISFWEVDRRVVIGALLLIGLLFIPVVRRLVRLPIGEWLQRHEPIAWAMLGVLWWTCLSPSAVGGMLLVVAAAIAVWERQREKTAPEVGPSSAAAAVAPPERSSHSASAKSSP